MHVLQEKAGEKKQKYEIVSGPAPNSERNSCSISEKVSLSNCGYKYNSSR